MTFEIKVGDIQNEDSSRSVMLDVEIHGSSMSLGSLRVGIDAKT